MSHIWDSITGGGEHKPAGSTSEPHPPVAKESHTQTVPKKEDESIFSLSALSHALDGGKHSPAPVPAPVATTEHTAPKTSSWTDTFHDLLDFGAASKKEAEEERLKLEKERLEKEAAAKKAEEEASFTGKLKGLFKSDKEEEEERQRLAAEAEKKRKEAEEAKRKEESWTAKIKQVFDGDNAEKEKERQRLLEEAKRNQTFGAKVRNIFASPPPPPPPKHSLSDKVLHAFDGDSKKQPEPEHGVFAKLNEALGGGSKGEKKEDHLDKTIDFVQEHVLRKGDQHNESAWEQAKDARIADAIRTVTGTSKDHKH